MTWKNGTWWAGKGGVERGKDYNHSTFCDLVITGLLGVQPQADGSIVIEPLIPDGQWDWFCLDSVECCGKTLTILYDKDGSKYHRGKGFRIFVNGRKAYSSDSYAVKAVCKILFVCHGNICRSPMAAFILKTLLKARGIESFAPIKELLPA